MPTYLDIVLVIATVSAATAYIVMRKVRSVRKINRDWTTGHAEACDHCPAIQIRQAQRIKLETGNRK